MFDMTKYMNSVYQEAEDILLYDQNGTATAEDAQDYVDYWLENAKPDWFDDGDKQMMINIVADKFVELAKTRA